MNCQFPSIVRIAAAFTFAVLSLFLATFETQAQTRRPRTQSARIEITNDGYQPGEITLKRGVPARITFLRAVNNSCAGEVVFADYGIRRELPLNKEVSVTFTPQKAGEFSFSCGMNMYRGKLIVR